MEFLYFLLKKSKWVSGGVGDWAMPHRLWYVSENGYALGIILAILIALIFTAIYYRVLPKMFSNLRLKRTNWFVTLLLCVGTVFLVTLLIARGGIISYAQAHGYLEDAPAMLTTLKKFTMDMWLYAAQNAIYAFVAYFLLSFLLRIKTIGRYVPF